MCTVDTMHRELTWFQYNHTINQRWYFGMTFESFPADIDIVKHLLNNDLDAFTRLILQQQQFDLDTQFHFFDEEFNYETTLLLFAIRFGSFEQFKWLLEQGASIDMCEYSESFTENACRSAIGIATEYRKTGGFIEIIDEWTHGGATIKSAK